MAIVENLDYEDLEEDSQSNSSSSEEDLAEIILEIQKTFRNPISPKTVNS